MIHTSRVVCCIVRRTNSVQRSTAVLIVGDLRRAVCLSLVHSPRVGEGADQFFKRPDTPTVSGVFLHLGT